MDELMRRIHRLEQRMQVAELVEIKTPVIARYTTVAGQSIPDTAITIVNYDTMVHDTNSLVTTGASWAFAPKQAGYYRVNAAIAYTTTTTWAEGEVGGLLLYKNGALYSRLDRNDHIASATTSQIKFLAGTDVVSLVVGDTISIRTNQASGGALTLFASAGYNYVTIHKI